MALVIATINKLHGKCASGACDTGHGASRIAVLARELVHVA